MLFRAAFLEKIRSGDVTLAFRRWRRPTVKEGSTLRTGAGVLQFTSIAVCREEDITEEDAQRAGFADLPELLRELKARTDGTLYRIKFRLCGEDPRIALREHDAIGDEECRRILELLDRMDSRDPQRPWTRTVLQAIADEEGIVAGKLGTMFGIEKAAVKRNVRKLKELGLTESLPAGYRLSPRGQALLRALANQAD
jgi:hypothetical protein